MDKPTAPLKSQSSSNRSNNKLNSNPLPQEKPCSEKQIKALLADVNRILATNPESQIKSKSGSSTYMSSSKISNNSDSISQFGKANLLDQEKPCLRKQLKALLADVNRILATNSEPQSKCSTKTVMNMSPTSPRATINPDCKFSGKESFKSFDNISISTPSLPSAATTNPPQNPK